MGLELLSNAPATQNNSKQPLLFVHGMWHGAWCWEPYFLPYFEHHGIKAYALSLSNHANSPRRKPFNLLRIGDYVKDVRKVVNSLEQKPILVGHSMGGFIVQKYLEKHDAPGAVLMASVPPYGVWGGTFSVLKKFPSTFLKANLTLHLKHIINSPQRYRQILCSNDFSNEEIVSCLEKIDTESYLAYVDMLGLNLVNTKKIKTPLLVLGGGKDATLPPKSVIKTAEKYKTKAVIFDDIPHMMMLSPGYKKVADKIIDWIASY